MALVSHHSKSPHLSPQSKALSANAYGEQRENKHTNLETAWESHGNNRQEEKKIKLMRKWTFAAGQGGPQENPEKL